ncbi:collagen-binding domain-containing protein [Oxalobacteraceae bacterium A2-2]
MTARRYALSAIAAAILSTSAAHAATTPLTATQMLQQFNLVVIGDLKSTSHVDGRALVGGNVSGGEFVSHPNTTPASNYAGLTVFGNASDNAKVLNKGAVVYGSVSGQNSDYNGDSWVGGNATGVKFQGNGWIVGDASGVGFNGGGHAAHLYNGTNNNNPLSDLTATMKTNLAAAQSASAAQISTTLGTLSSDLSKLKSTETAANGGVFRDGTKVTFNAEAKNGVAVFDLTSLDTLLFSSGTTEMNLNLNGASTVIFNTDDKVLTTSANFNFGNANGAKIIWNFAGATSVTVNTTIVGQVLATNATFTNANGANVEGGVFAKAVNQYGEIHQQAFTGTIPAAPVPEPETYAMLLGGLGLMGLMARRRQRS